MNCVEWEERIALCAGGDLAPAEAQAVDCHIAECAGCRELLVGLRESLALVREAHAEPIETAHFAAVRARVLAELEHAPARRWRFAWLGAMAAAAVVLTMAIWPRPELRLAVPMPVAPAAPVVARTVVPPPRPKTVVRPRPAQPVQQAAAPPTVVKLLTDDPDVVIYWITDTKGE